MFSEERWTPCQSVMGFSLHAPVTGHDLQKRGFVSVGNDEFGNADYVSVDRSCCITLDADGFVTASFQKVFFVGETNVIGISASEAIAQIRDVFGDLSAVVTYDDWVEVFHLTYQRFIDFEDLCMFVTEDDKNMVVSVDVYG